MTIHIAIALHTIVIAVVIAVLSASHRCVSHDWGRCVSAISGWGWCAIIDRGRGCYYRWAGGCYGLRIRDDGR